MKNLKSVIPQELQDLKQWVCAYKSKKIPFSPLTFKGASTSDPNTWVDFTTALNAVETRKFDYLGFVFNNTNDIVGIDIDCGTDENGFLNPLCVDFIKLCNSYTERSKSGRGVHIFLKGTIPFDGANNQKGIEIYKSKRFFIMTGNTIQGYETINHNQQAIDEILQKHFTNNLKENEKTKSFKNYNFDFNIPKNNKINLTPNYKNIGQGNRTISLLSIAGTFYNVGYTLENIYNELLAINAKHCTPPLQVAEIQSIVKSISKYKRR